MEFDYDIFISHSSVDEEFVNRLEDCLRQEGHRVWRNSVKAGEHIVGAIEQGLAKSRVFSLVLSNAALTSGWVEQEYFAAFKLGMHDKRREIIPLRREKVASPPFIDGLSFVDFSEGTDFEASVKQLSGALRSIARPEVEALPEGSSRVPLHELMLSAKQELLISVHTGDKFTTNTKVIQALHSLLDKSVNVTIILLNPHSPYARAHDRFHTQESRTTAQQQIAVTIDRLRWILSTSDQPKCLAVYLTRYMPRFRTVLVDNEDSHVNLYMYGTDVLQTPEFAFSNLVGGATHSEFEALKVSLHRLLSSPDVFPLILDGWYDPFWESSQIESHLDNCLAGACSKVGCAAVRALIKRGQTDQRPTGAAEQLCAKGYTPGTVRADRAPQLIGPTATDNRSLVKTAVERRISWMSTEYPDCFPNSGEPGRHERLDLARKTAAALSMLHSDHAALWSSVYLEHWEDVVDRTICSVRFGHPEPMLTGKSRTASAKDQGLALIQWVKDHKTPSLAEWLRLSIAAEAFSFPGLASDVASTGEQLWEYALSVERIDASEFFFHLIRTSYQLPLHAVCFPSTLLATLFTLKFYDEMLQDADTLHVDFVPRSVNVGTYASYRDVFDVLPRFETLHRLQLSRFRVHEDGPKLRSVDARRGSMGVTEAMERAVFLDARGSLAYRSLQKIRKLVFFGFLAQDGFDLDLVGSSASACLVFIRQYPEQQSFKLAEVGPEGRPATIKRLLDNKERWSGGPIANFGNWPAKRKQAFQITREFYTNRAAQFRELFGDPEKIELNVKEALSELSDCQRILVLGCGSGKEVRYLKSNNQNSRIVGMDLITEPILHARSRYAPREDFLVADYYELSSLFDDKFDGLVANAAFVHLIEHSDLAGMMQAIEFTLLAGGKAFIRVLEKGSLREEIYRASEFFGAERWFVYYHDSEFTSLAESAGLTVLKRDRRKHDHYEGVYWLSYVLQKPRRGRPDATTDVVPLAGNN